MQAAHMALFPYRPRDIQSKMMGAMVKALDGKGHVVIEAGTGSGKTISALAPCVHNAFSERKRVLYLTRTNSQQRQVVEEFRRIRAHAQGLPVQPKSEMAGPDVVDEILEELNKGERRSDVRTKPSNVVPDRGPWEGGPSKGICTAVQGRSNMCPLTSEDPELLSGTPEELSRMCAERKRNALSRMSGKPLKGPECRFYSAFLLDEGMEARSWARDAAPTAEELASRCLMMGICPYEVTKAMMKESVLVTAPYIFLLSPFIRGRLLEWMDCPLEDLIVVVDEAHNLAQFARELCSLSLSSITIHLALSEVQSWGEKPVGEGRSLSDLLLMFERALISLADEFLIDDDGLVPPSALTEALMVIGRTNSAKLESMVSEMLHHGSAIQEARRAQGKLPRSYIHRVASFYLTWCELDFSSYSPLVVKGPREGNLSLEAFAMDPALITSVLGSARSTVHISGTLSPLEEYRDTIGLPEDTALVRLPPPFPPSNRMVVFDRELSTNFETLNRDPGMKERYRDALIRTLSCLKDRNSAVFFPSFDLMDEILDVGELEDGSVLPNHTVPGRPFFIERRGSSQAEVMELVDDFRSSNGGVLCSVIGGRLSEGMDYPGRALELVVVVGIPYPKPNARQRALQSFYEVKFRKGWEYTVHAPAARKILQAVGRMIRSEEERGFALILDRRAFHFKGEIPDLTEARSDLSDMISFFTRKD